MNYTFEIIKELDFDSFTEANRKLYRDMVKIASGTADKYEVIDYAKALSDCGRILSSRDLYFWCEAENTTGMPAEERVEFIYLPTYMAVCILARAYMLLEDDGRSYEPLTDALYRGLNGAMGRKFLGHSFESEEGLLDALEIFRAGGLEGFVESHPAFNMEFSKMYAEAQEYAAEIRKNRSDLADHSFKDSYIDRNR